MPSQFDFDDDTPPARRRNGSHARSGSRLGLYFGVFVLILATIGVTLWATGFFGKLQNGANTAIAPKLTEQQKAAAAEAIKALGRMALPTVFNIHTFHATLVLSVFGAA